MWRGFGPAALTWINVGVTPQALETKRRRTRAKPKDVTQFFYQTDTRLT
jgi:hypothetical protein